MKPLLIGINNPVNTAPGYELYPLPKGCTGNRIFEMLRERQPQITMRDYLETFERRNLVTGVDFDRKMAARNAALMYAEFWGSGRTVVLLGQSVQKAFGIPPLLLHPQVIGGCTWRQVPHPSGRNLWYNEKNNRHVVAMLMEELYVEYTRNEAVS